MIKPVKRNKRLKWIDSHYAYRFLIDDLFEGNYCGPEVFDNVSWTSRKPKRGIDHTKVKGRVTK
jgi:hypothetical protein